MTAHRIPLLAAPVARRHVLAAAALALPFPRLARLRAGVATTWEEFLERAPDELAELARAATPAEQDAYLYALASLVARVEHVPGGKLERFAALEPAVLFGMLHRGQPFFVVEWRLEPHAALPAHCHPGASVVTLALEGAAEIRHYEVEPGAPAFDSGSEAPFALRETRRQRLRPGGVSHALGDARHSPRLPCRRGGRPRHRPQHAARRRRALFLRAARLGRGPGRGGPGRGALDGADAAVKWARRALDDDSVVTKMTP
jgi:hypothetical protein